MTITEKISLTYEQAVDQLAVWQGESSAPDLRIFAFEDPARQEIRLVHVSEEIADRGGIRFFTMGKTSELPFKSVVALTVPKYWDRVLAGDPLLPEGWTLANYKKVWPK